MKPISCSDRCFYRSSMLLCSSRWWKESSQEDVSVVEEAVGVDGRRDVGSLREPQIIAPPTCVSLA